LLPATLLSEYYQLQTLLLITVFCIVGTSICTFVYNGFARSPEQPFILNLVATCVLLEIFYVAAQVLLEIF